MSLEASSPPAPVGRKGGPIPKHARNQTELGRYLMPPRDRKIIQRAMKLEGCPGRSPEGKYPIAEWQTFISAKFASRALTDDSAQPDKLKLEMEKLRLTNEKLQFELSVKKRDFTANTDIEIWVGDMVMQAKRVLLGLPSKLAPQLAGMTEVEIEATLKTEINGALAQLSARPLHGVTVSTAELTDTPSAT
jgi:hypothetical protein